MDNDAAEEKELIRRTNSIYLTVILRYKNYIEQSEALYTPDLPRLIEPENAAVAALANKIKDSFKGYEYERDFASAAEEVYKHIKREVSTMSLPIQFWQKPEETLENKAGDVFDKAVLMCSTLSALGCANAKVLLSIDGTREVAVFFESGNGIRAYRFDEEKAHEFGSIEEMRNWIQQDKEAQVYVFNSRSCVDL